MIARRKLLIAAGAGALAASLRSFAQPQPKKVTRIGWFESGTPASSPERRKAFLEVLRESGHVEGKNLVIDYRYGHGKSATYPALAAELVALKPDCIVAVGVGPIRAVRQATSTIPIVMGTIDADPVKVGLVASLARPGGNITGLTGIAWELAGKRLELLREVAPKASRVAVIFDPRSPAGHAHVQETEVAARALKVPLQLLEASEPIDLETAFQAARQARAEALFVVAAGMPNSHRPRIVKLAIEARLPAIYSNLESVTDGGLMAYAPNTVEQFRRAAIYVDKILKGVKPADLPIEQPTKFELVVNLKTAKALGIKIPQSILARADRVIE